LKRDWKEHWSQIRDNWRDIKGAEIALKFFQRARKNIERTLKEVFKHICLSILKSERRFASDLIHIIDIRWLKHLHTLVDQVWSQNKDQHVERLKISSFWLKENSLICRNLSYYKEHFMITCLRDYKFTWLQVYMITWLHDYMITCLHDYMIT
jgi:hypothetical protein